MTNGKTSVSSIDDTAEGNIETLNIEHVGRRAERRTVKAAMTRATPWKSYV